MAMTIVGYGVHLLGHAYDLQDWAEELKEPFEPHVEVYGEKYVLRSTAFADLNIQAFRAARRASRSLSTPTRRRG